MNRQELLARVRQHEAACANGPGAFHVCSVWELAEGVIAVLDKEGEFTLYFDRSQVENNGKHAKDVGNDIGLPSAGTGFMEDELASSLLDIAETARKSLRAVPASSAIKWHSWPVTLHCLP